MPNKAEGSLDKRTNSLESTAQVLSQKSGPYDLTKSEAALTTLETNISIITFLIIKSLKLIIKLPDRNKIIMVD